MTQTAPTPRNWQEHDLLSREAPRYTSYPAANHFGALASEVQAGWLAALPVNGSIGLYVHVPFCEQMCWFCGCNTQITRQYDPISSYVDRLVQEICHVADTIGHAPRVHSLHFGGGSPGLLRPDDLTRLLHLLRSRFNFASDAEVSIELDPRRVTNENAKVYAALGFNRVSLGVQDTDPRVQAAINRVQPAAQVLACADRLGDAGIKALGIDLIYGLPFQTPEAFAQTLSDALALAPSRLSGFSYAHVPWARKHQTLVDSDALPTDDEKLALFGAMTETLVGAGYQPVGIDHFAREDDGLAVALETRRLRRNFMGYTDMPNDRLLAFGASSISQFDEGIAQNASQSTTYQRLIAEQGLATVRGWTLTAEDRLRTAVIAELMCYFEADLDTILADHGFPASHFDAERMQLKALAEVGVISLDGAQVRLTSPYKMLIRNVAATFDTYLTPTSGARYSRVA